MGPDNPKTLWTANALAVTYEDQGKTEDAERLFRKCFDQQVATLGIGHSDTLLTVQNLASHYTIHSQHEKVKRFFVECADLQKQSLGPGNPNASKELAALQSRLPDWPRTPRQAG